MLQLSCCPTSSSNHNLYLSEDSHSSTPLIHQKFTDLVREKCEKIWGSIAGLFTEHVNTTSPLETERFLTPESISLEEIENSETNSITMKTDHSVKDSKLEVDSENQKDKSTASVFIVMRHAATVKIRRKDKTQEPDLCDAGKKQAKITAKEIHKIRQERGLKKIVIVVSDMRRSRQTGEILADQLGINNSEIILDTRIREAEIIKKSRKQIEIAKQYMQLSDDQKFKTAEPRRYESGLAMYERERQAIDETLDSIPNSMKDTLVVFVSHGVVMKNFCQGLFSQTKNDLLKDFSTHDTENCEMYFFKRNGKKIEPLHRSTADFRSLSSKSIMSCLSCC